MKRIWFILFVFLAGCVFGPSLNFSPEDAVGKRNLLVNGDFEKGDYAGDKIPAGWIVMENKNQTPIIWDNLSAVSNDKCLQFAPSANKILLISDSFPILSTNAYLTKLKMKSDIINENRVTVRFLTFDENGDKKESNRLKIKPEKEWKEFFFSTAFFSKRTKFARIIIEIPASSKKKIWIDDVGSFDVYKFK